MEPVKDIQKTKSLNPMTRNSWPNMDELEELREKMHIRLVFFRNLILRKHTRF